MKVNDALLAIGEAHTLGRIVGKIVGRQGDELVRQVQYLGQVAGGVLVVTIRNAKGDGAHVDATIDQHAQDGA